MANPTPSAKPTSPNGFKMPDGYQALVAFKNAFTIQLWIQTIKFAGIDGGEKINTTTMYNQQWRTFAARKLKTMEDITFKAAFDPDIFNPNSVGGGIQGVINDATETITEFWPDGSTRCYYGYLMKMGAPEMKEGEFPVADFTIVCTNYDVVNGVEAGFVFTPSSGT